MTATAFTIRAMRVSSWAGIGRKLFAWKKLLALRAGLMSVSSRTGQMVLDHVFRLANHFKVFDSIVKTVAVPMVHNLLRERFQLVTKMLFHDVAMLRNLHTFYVNQFVPTVNGATALRCKHSNVGITVPFESFVVGATISRTAALSPPTGFSAALGFAREVKRGCLPFLRSESFKHRR